MKTALLRTGAATEVSHYCEFGQRSVKGIITLLICYTNINLDFVKNMGLIWL